MAGYKSRTPGSLWSTCEGDELYNHDMTAEREKEKNSVVKGGLFFCVRNFWFSFLLDSIMSGRLYDYEPSTCETG